MLLTRICLTPLRWVYRSVFALLFLMIVGCRPSIEHSVTIRVVSPSAPYGSRIFVAGNIDQLGGWDPSVVALDHPADSVWEKTFSIKEDVDVEFQITRGSWLTGEMDTRGIQYGFNHAFRVLNDTLIAIRVSRWKDLAGGTTSVRLSDITQNNGFWITNGWRYKPGDDSSWISPGFDDRGWELVNSQMYPDNQPADGWHGLGWFRLHLEVDSLLWNYPLAFRLWQTGASEVYLDGKLLQRLGVVGHSPDSEQSFEDRSPKVILFSPQTDHILAIRYSNFSPERFTRVGIYAGFEILLSEVNGTIDGRIGDVRQTSVLQMVFTTIPLVLALLHLSIFFFYPRSRENLYYALCMIGFAGITFSNNQPNFTTSAYQVLMLDVVGKVSQIIAVVTGLLMFHSLAYHKIPRRGLVAVGLGIVLTIWALLLPNRTLSIAKDIFTGIVLLEIVIGYFRSGQRSIEGASIIRVGSVIVVMTAAYEILAGNGIIPTIANIRGTHVYGALAFSVSMSIFLSRRFANTNRQLELQLQQVRELSARTLDQERRARDAEVERRVLTADNERKTKELDEARKFQISLLPKEVPKLPGLAIAAFSVPATEVGGDYYDFAGMPDGPLTVVLGDATGHGAKAGTMVAVTKGLFHELAHLPAITDILGRSNNAIKGMDLGSMFMGMSLLRISGTALEFTVAGMPPMLIYRASTHDVEQVIVKGMPLGAFTDFRFEHRSLDLNAGDAVVLMSDGFPERFNQNKETLEFAAIIDLFRMIGSRSPQEVIDQFLQKAEEWASGSPQNDDMTFVVIKKL